MSDPELAEVREAQDADRLVAQARAREQLLAELVAAAGATAHALEGLLRARNRRFWTAVVAAAAGGAYVGATLTLLLV